MTHSSPSSSALVCRLATSDPAPGSENIWHHIVLRRDVVGEEALLLLVGAVLGEHRQAHAVADGELAVGHRVVALDFAPDLLVRQGLAATAVLARHRQPGEAGFGCRGEERLLVVERGVLPGSELLHEVDALLAELRSLGLGQSGGGVGHVIFLQGVRQRSTVAILYGIVQYVSTPNVMSTANLTTHELDSPPWLRVESTLMATARLLRVAFDTRLAALDLNLNAGLAARLRRGVRHHHADRPRDHLGIGRPPSAR